MAQVEEIYVSTDIETNGPIPGDHSMLSFASAAFTLSKGMIGTFTSNLDFLEGSSPDPSTMTEFWDKNPDAWAAARKDPQPPKLAMERYAAWLRSLPGKPIFVGYPATFDQSFIHWYMIHFTGSDPFGFSGLDVKSYAMAVLKKPFRETIKRNMPKSWFPEGRPHTHVALDDAIEQGELFMNILRANGANHE